MWKVLEILVALRLMKPLLTVQLKGPPHLPHAILPHLLFVHFIIAMMIPQNRITFHELNCLKMLLPMLLAEDLPKHFILTQSEILLITFFLEAAGNDFVFPGAHRYYRGLHL